MTTFSSPRRTYVLQELQIACLDTQLSAPYNICHYTHGKPLSSSFSNASHGQILSTNSPYPSALHKLDKLRLQSWEGLLIFLKQRLCLSTTLWTYNLRGLDSSHHVWNNVNIERGMIWSISIHSIYKGEALFFSLCTFNMAIDSFEVNVDVKNGP